MGELAREVPLLLEHMREAGGTLVTNKMLNRLVVFSADKIELEWPTVSELPGDQRLRCSDAVL